MKRLKSFGPNLPPCGLKVLLCDRNPSITENWANVFSYADGVEIWEGDLLALDGDALVSPANSFGDMGGGIDKHIDDAHHGAAQSAVMAAIREQWFGELPVGMAIVVTLPSNRWPYLVCAPTMRIPRNVAGSINAYLAMRAALVAVLKFNANSARPIRTLAIPGLCTGVGGMPTQDAAEQMRSAYDNIVLEEWKRIQHPLMAPYTFR